MMAAPDLRIGEGWDVHQLVTGRPLVLGGITIAHSHGLLGHSDADALLHAITDALLGGAGLGDIVMMRVYLVGVPSLDGKMDSAGMNEAYRTFFGTPEQPNKPARATVQVAALGSPTTLVEIEVQAVKKR